jgi:hypothetical protein
MITMCKDMGRIENHFFNIEKPIEIISYKKIVNSSPETQKNKDTKCDVKQSICCIIIEINFHVKDRFKNNL